MQILDGKVVAQAVKDDLKIKTLEFIQNGNQKS